MVCNVTMYASKILSAVPYNCFVAYNRVYVNVVCAERFVSVGILQIKAILVRLTPPRQFLKPPAFFVA
jgi:hypothetical protein